MQYTQEEIKTDMLDILNFQYIQYRYYYDNVNIEKRAFSAGMCFALEDILTNLFNITDSEINDRRISFLANRTLERIDLHDFADQLFKKEIK